MADLEVLHPGSGVELEVLHPAVSASSPVRPRGTGPVWEREGICTRAPRAAAHEEEHGRLEREEEEKVGADSSAPSPTVVGQRSSRARAGLDPPLACPRSPPTPAPTSLLPLLHPAGSR
ncbi:unnamed protein product [Urochloa humidicola]